MNKKWFLSKTVWVNIIGTLQIILGPDIISNELQVSILGIINLILRFITKEPIAW